MGKPRKYIKKSADGRFFLFVDRPIFPEIDLNKKTKLWISSPYLFEESIKEDPQNTKKQLENMLKWNESQQNYEVCKRIIEMQKRFETSMGDRYKKNHKK
jgi:hypothetical protein